MRMSFFKCAPLYKNDALRPLFPALQINRKASFLQKKLSIDTFDHLDTKETLTALWTVIG